jgi:hypothetical protein
MELIMKKKTKDQEAVWSHETIEIIKSAFSGGKRLKSNVELAALTGKTVGSIRGIISRLGLNKGLPSAIKKPTRTEGIPFLQLEASDCRAIISQDGLDVLFCGQKIVPGCSYCAVHKKLFLHPGKAFNSKGSAAP